MKVGKKICIVTWLGAGNYGTSLQAFALHKYLSINGYIVSIVSSIPHSNGFISYIKYIFKVLGLFFIIEKWKNRNKSQYFRKIDKFKRRNFNVPSLFTKTQRVNFINSIDVFVAGSDQIWNTYFCYNPFMFLDFVVNKRKIAYASSIGTNSIKEEYKEDVKRLLLRFDCIGVRESSAVRVLSTLTNRKDIVHVLDPTFLLEKKDWEEACRETSIGIQIPNKFILCYLIGENEWYYKQLEKVKMVTGINKVVIIPSKENPKFNFNESVIYNNADPLEFVKLIGLSTFICTDSFHATALSINLNKNFVEFMRFDDSEIHSQNSRVYDILSRYKLMNRIFNSESILWSTPIDYKEVEFALKKDRESSKLYLINAIEHK